MNLPSGKWLFSMALVFTYCAATLLEINVSSKFEDLVYMAGGVYFAQSMYFKLKGVTATVTEEST